MLSGSLHLRLTQIYKSSKLPNRICMFKKLHWVQKKVIKNISKHWLLLIAEKRFQPNLFWLLKELKISGRV